MVLEIGKRGGIGVLISISVVVVSVVVRIVVTDDVAAAPMSTATTIVGNLLC